MGKKKVKEKTLLLAWKAFIQLIFSLQGEREIGKHFSGKLMQPDCPDSQFFFFLLQAACQIVSAFSEEAENTES